jgi:hypothetical protein
MIECLTKLHVDVLINRTRLEEYNKRALERDSEEVFSSDAWGSTTLLLRTLFNNYNKSAKIFGTSLCNKILSDEECRKGLELFGSPVNIVLTHSPNNISNKIKNYFNSVYGNVQIKEINGYAIQHAEKNIESDFLILDDTAYLLELTESKLSRCSFNNPKGALNLSKQFDDIYNRH